MAKKLTLGILVLVLFIGIIMLFIKSLDMERYSIFLKAFSPFYISLIASIGVNSGIEKFNSGKEKSTLGWIDVDDGK